MAIRAEPGTGLGSTAKVEAFVVGFEREVFADADDDPLVPGVGALVAGITGSDGVVAGPICQPCFWDASSPAEACPVCFVEPGIVASCASAGANALIRMMLALKIPLLCFVLFICPKELSSANAKLSVSLSTI